MVDSQTIIIASIFGVLLVMVGLQYSNSQKKKSLNPDEKQVKSNYDPKLIKLIVGTLVLLIILGGISFKFFIDQRGESFSLSNIGHWLNNTCTHENDITKVIKLEPAAIIAGMVFGIIFGFIDNAGLFFGMDALDPYVKKISKDPKISAGIGNTFSDVIGAFAGTFAGSIVKQLLNQQLKSKLPDGIPDGPMWAEAIGILIGCVLGIIIPSAIVG